MTTDEVERKGGCVFYKEADPEETKTKLLKNLTKLNNVEPYEAIIDLK